MKRENGKYGKKIVAVGLALVLGFGVMPHFSWADACYLQAWAAENESNRENAPVELDADPIELTADMFASINENVTYNGYEYTPEVVLTQAGTDAGLTAEDYAISYQKKADSGDLYEDISSVKAVGTYKVLVSASGTGNASSNGPIDIGSVEIEMLDFEAVTDIFAVTNLIYTGRAQTPALTVSSNYGLTEGTTGDYTYSYADSEGHAIGAEDIIDVGTYQVVVESTGVNCTGRLEIPFEIQELELTDDDVAVSNYTVGTNRWTLTVGNLTEDDYTFEIKDANGNVVGNSAEDLYGYEVIESATYTVEITITNSNCKVVNPLTASFEVEFEETGTISPRSSNDKFVVTGTTISPYYGSDGLTITLAGDFSSGYVINTEDQFDDISLLGTSVSGVQNGDLIFVKHTGGDGAVNEYTVVDYIRDDEPPQLAFDDADTENWAEEKSIGNISAEDGNGMLGIFYSEGEDVLRDITAITDGDKDEQLAKVTEVTNGSSITISDELDADGTTYWIYAIDCAGNITRDFTQVCKIDRYDPVIDVAYSAGTESGAYIFSGAIIQVDVTVSDSCSGVQSFIITVLDENGKEVSAPTTVSGAEGLKNKDYSFAIPLSGQDFKGSIQIEASDWAGKEVNKTQKLIVESAAKFSDSGSIDIHTNTSPSRTVNGVDYYNTDVSVTLTMKESYSGLRTYQYSAGSQFSESGAFDNLSGINHTYTKTLTLSASANNQNRVRVDASFASNTGYTEEAGQSYNIDITKPTIEVTYDNNNARNGSYYSNTRTATVVITERNFSADDVKFSITGTNGASPSISGWKTSGSGDSTKHTATVTFSADADYTFTVSFRDLAGNKADYSRVDKFTIDRTFPTYSVTYDNNQYQNGYYYKAGRVATVDILEHNFDASLIKISVTKDGTSIMPSVSGWMHNGDHHIATVSFLADGDYTLAISGMDLAGNNMKDYATDRFVVDTTAPELEIFNIEDQSANNGVVQPGIQYSDINYDADAIEIVIDGYHNGTLDMDALSRIRSITLDGVELLFDDFEYVREMDDIYTMSAAVYDLAGNSSEASVTFSVNRFGSVYTFDESTDALVGDNGQYYTNEEPTIVVIETNVDTLEEHEVVKNFNGELTTLSEEENYTVKSSGTEMSWKQYTYTLSADNFVSEGEYALTFMSRDRATNSNVNTNQAQVAFMVDKTAPTVSVSNIKDGGQYRQDTLDISISATDNVRLASVTVDNDGEKTEYGYEDMENGTLVHTLASSDSRQMLQVMAVDAAGNMSEFMSIVDENGNVTEANSVQYLLTTNVWRQLLAHTVLLIFLIIIIAAIFIILWLLFWKRNKNNKNEEPT